MKDLNWYFPKSIAEAVDLVQQGKILPHAGGTGLLPRGFTGIDGLIDLSRLPLRYSKIENGSVEIGSMNTYAEAVSALMAIDPDHILVKSLRNSANTPLRNRITIGGSIAFFPPWSDLIGALLALEAKLVLVGKNSGEFSVTDYVTNKALREKSLIAAVKFNLSNWRSYHYRDIRTKSDYPAFNITILLKQGMNKIEDSRVIIVGTVKKYSRLTIIEEYLKNRDVGKINIEEIEKLVEVKLVGKRIEDPEYSSYLAGVELGRGIEHLLRGH
ncbi:MAG: FAD binding domain-containing protein, partial [Candidatus Marinimicrobia bacterium]|nr:FAD binding domain-containing protein [Candidatus Neomarinimicrobiota bacterium]